METIKQTHLVDKIINGLKKTAVELEEFRLQAALGNKALALTTKNESLQLPKAELQGLHFAD